MAQINTYAIDSTINGTDKLIGSDSANSDITRQFRLDDISDYVRGNIVLGDVTSISATASELNVLDGITATTAELNLMDGVTATTAEINYLDGVTSAIQTQINAINEFEPTNTGTANQVLQRTSGGYQWANASAVSYTLTAATSTTLGGVIVQDSSDIDINASGHLTLGNISASKITSGVFDNSRLSTGTPTNNQVLTYNSSNDTMVWTNKGSATITFGSGLGEVATWAQGNDTSTIPSSKLPTLAASSIPELATSKITTGTFDRARLSSDTPTNGQALTWQGSDSTMVWSDAVTFGNAAGNVAPWAQGNNTTRVPASKATISYTDALTITTTGSGATPETGIELYRNSSSAANDDEGNSIDFAMNSSAQTSNVKFNAAEITSSLHSQTVGSIKLDAGELEISIGNILNATETQLRVAKFSREGIELGTGMGVKLGGTTSANELDDYEEGTWTPSFGTTGKTLSITSGTADYVKIGHLCHVTLRGTSTGTADGSNIQIAESSLPFTHSSNHFLGGTFYSHGTGNTGSGTAYLTGTQIFVKRFNNGSILTDSNLGASFSLHLTYITT